MYREQLFNHIINLSFSGKTPYEAASSNKQVGKFLFKYTMRALAGIDMPNPSEGKTNSIKVLGDGSPSTLWDNKSWRRIYPRLKEPPYVNADVIAAVTPGVKLIIILRDPVERLYSSYNFFNRHNKPSPETFHDVAQNSVEFFEACLARDGSLRGCTYQSSDRTQFGHFHTEFTGGLYYVYLKDWLRAFPKEQILILELSDWHINCEENLTRVYKLLDLDPSSGEIVRQSCNQPTRVRTYRKMPRPMLNETRRYLQQKYEPFKTNAL
ncbi:putative carbohydrate sulfotransferase 15 [Apostichopus japonicus]|uniref:Putative carbohydrate sulfotransferase 15 n=1 Tax=Stichopus japonicus TaxID=307972 RepID=A0A2G8K4A0_STIJA|nr:putative carbohydrate sulfotransferase 15 [Apostichopus japonicus]